MKRLHLLWGPCVVGVVVACSSAGSGGAAPMAPPVIDPGPDGSPSDAAVPPETGAFLQHLDTFRKGGTIPAANGAPAFVIVVNPDGSKTITTTNPNGTQRLLLQWTDAGNHTVKSDVNGDGIVDGQTTVTTTNGRTTSLFEHDQNLSGKFNWRNTITSDSSRTGSSLHSVIEEISPFGTDFAVTASYNGSAFQLAKPKCVPAQLPGSTCQNSVRSPEPKYCPPQEPAVAEVKCGTNPDGGNPCVFWVGPGQPWRPDDLGLQTLFDSFLVITKGPLKCTGQIEQLGRVLAKSAADLDTVLPKLNDARYAKVMAGLASAPLIYGCDLPTEGNVKAQNVTALTHGAYFDDDPLGDKTYAKAIMSAYEPADFVDGDDNLEELLVHEWFHAAGDSHPHDADGWEQRDWIYSCARIVDGGRAFAQGHYLGVCCDASSARDFASCVSDEKKAEYGVQNIFKETATSFIEVPQQGLQSFDNIAVPDECFDSVGGGHEQCGCALHRIPSYCDQVTLTEADALTHYGLTAGANSLSQYNCCERCPSGAPEAYVCGTHDPTSNTRCLPQSTCASLPAPNSQIAAGPTVPLRNPAAAFLEGQVTFPGNGVNATLNCPAVTGFLY